MDIVPYEPARHRGAVQRLNERFTAEGVGFRLPIDVADVGDEKPAVWAEDFVAFDDGNVYGGYHLKHQQFFVDGQLVDLGNLQLPLSLGLIDRRYANVSTGLIFDALHRSERLYCLGMGSQERPLVKILTAMGWSHLVVPFLFSVKRSNRFARNVRLPKNRAKFQQMTRVAGWLRLAGLALWLQKAIKHVPRASGVERLYGDVEIVPRLGDLADELFQAHEKEYSLVGDRSQAALNCLYPERNAKFIRLVVKQGGRPIGWAVLLDTRMRDHKYFGNMRVGSLADCFAAPAHAAAVVQAADEFLTDRGVDLVVSNQMHTEWLAALKSIGYQHGPSNFFFYFSPVMAERLTARPGWDRRLHINRGDGDGPIHL